MGSFEIEGGHKLKGAITPQGAKNEALQTLCAVLLTDEKVTISNIPNIVDVNKLINLLKNFGVKVNLLSKGKYQFQADQVDMDFLNSSQYKNEAKQLRGSVMLVGPMLSRFGKGSVPRPGGDKIGRRRLDTHFEGLKLLGADFNYNRQDYFYTVIANKLNGVNILLEEASVTGTANILMASVLASGKTTIYNDSNSLLLTHSFYFF